MTKKTRPRTEDMPRITDVFGTSDTAEPSILVPMKTLMAVKTELEDYHRLREDIKNKRTAAIDRAYMDAQVEMMKECVNVLERPFSDFFQQGIAHRVSRWVGDIASRKRKTRSGPLVWLPDGRFTMHYKVYKQRADGTAVIEDMEAAKQDDELAGAALVIEKEIEKKHTEELLERTFKEWCETVMRSLGVIISQTETIAQITEQIELIETPRELREFMSQVKLMLAKAREISEGRVGICR